MTGVGDRQPDWGAADVESGCAPASVLLTPALEYHDAMAAGLL
jgi:hypothetical protein